MSGADKAKLDAIGAGAQDITLLTWPATVAIGDLDADGKLDIAVNGSAVVTVALGDSTAADKTYGQSSSAAGYVGTIAVTATTVGTAFII